MPESLLGLGSNLGDREALLRAAVADLRAVDAVTVTAASPIYETAPWGPVPQDAYLNACIAVCTALSPNALLDACHAIENRHGRERDVRFGPRTLDIDILTYDDLEIDGPRIILPHPRVTVRAFVLVPLAAIAPELVIGGRPLGAWLAETGTEGIVERPDLAPLLAPRS